MALGIVKVHLKIEVVIRDVHVAGHIDIAVTVVCRGNGSSWDDLLVVNLAARVIILVVEVLVSLKGWGRVVCAGHRCHRLRVYSWLWEVKLVLYAGNVVVHGERGVVSRAIGVGRIVYVRHRSHQLLVNSRWAVILILGVTVVTSLVQSVRV